MDIKIEGFYIDNSEFYQLSLDLRNSIFTEELGFNKHLEFDGKDKNAMHYLVLCDGIPVGCSRWIENKESIRMDRFAISKEFRGRVLGILLIKFIKSEIIPSGKKIEILTTDDSVVFFIQQGFKDSNIFEQYDKKKVRVLNF